MNTKGGCIIPCMPLDNVGRRYADRVYQNRFEEIQREYVGKSADVERDFTRRNMLRSGSYIGARARLLIEQIGALGQAKAESLLRAYVRSGLPFDDTTLQEITTEVMSFCHGRQHHAVSAIVNLTTQVLGPQNTKAGEAVTEQIVHGVSAVMARIERDLSIKRDEVILDEMKVRRAYAAGLGKRWDVFISHATEDKDEFVRPLSHALGESGLSVWFDETALTVGDSLRAKIDEGLSRSRYGIVVLSKHFFAKKWPQNELDGLMAREVAGTKVILPVWHKVTRDEVELRSPMLAGRLAALSDEGLEITVRKLREAMGLA